MKRNPKVGDLVMFGTSTKPMLVIEAEQHVSDDRLRGDAYYAYTFEVISEDKLGVVNPKPKKYVVTGASMSIAKHIGIDLSDIFLVEAIKIKKTVVSKVTYTRKK